MMKKVISLIRINKNNLNYSIQQKQEIMDYIKKNSMTLDDSIEVEVSVPREEENIYQILSKKENFSTIIVSDLNVLARTTDLIYTYINELLDHNIRIISVNQNLDLVNKEDMLTQIVLGVMKMTIDVEKDLMSLRTKEALNAKRIEGVNLGKPKGTIQKSKFDKQRAKIEELLSVGLSVRKIAKLLGYNNHIGLNNYIRKRDIRSHVNALALEIAS